MCLFKVCGLNLCKLDFFTIFYFVHVISNLGEGAVLDQEKHVPYFLDEMSLSAVRQVNMSHLKIKTRLFVD